MILNKVSDCFQYASIPAKAPDLFLPLSLKTISNCPNIKMCFDFLLYHLQLLIETPLIYL